MRHTVSRPVLTLLSVSVLLAGAGGAWWYGNHDHVRLLAFERDAGDLLREIVTKSQLPVDRASAIDRLAADGSQPDSAMQTLVVAAPRDVVRRGLGNACHSVGLDRPDAMTAGTDPDAICEGSWRGGAATVSATVLCSRSCRVDLAVRHLWF